MSAARRGPNPPPLDEAALRALMRERLERELPTLQVIVRGVAWKANLRDAAAVDELLGEVVQQVMQQARKYDPSRSIVAWASGFLGPILAQRKSQQKKSRRQVPAMDLGAEVEDLMFEKLDRARRSEDPSPDVDVWLAQLSEADRVLIERRYFDGLNGAALALAVGLPSAAAARTRLCRALKNFREIAHREGGAS